MRLGVFRPITLLVHTGFRRLAMGLPGSTDAAMRPGIR